MLDIIQAVGAVLVFFICRVLDVLLCLVFGVDHVGYVVDDRINIFFYGLCWRALFDWFFEIFPGSNDAYQNHDYDYEFLHDFVCVVIVNMVVL